MDAIAELLSLFGRSAVEKQKGERRDSRPDTRPTSIPPDVASLKGLGLQVKGVVRVPQRKKGNVMIEVIAVRFSSKPKTHQNITHLKLRDPRSRVEWDFTVAEVIDLIDVRHIDVCVVDGSPHPIPVEVVDKKYVRTKPDGTRENNLLRLPEF